MKRWTATILVLMLSCFASPALSTGLPGTTETVFNKRFLYEVKPMMAYEQLVKLAGSPGKKIAVSASPSTTVFYHWNGGRKSALDAKVVAGKVVELTVTTPKKKKMLLGKNGEVVVSGE